ncbi:conserved hypothetical protein [Ixodes scapularis]|uniref:Transport and Golgi organization protein 2 homolog n=1 Tax=Ixodes scapularis TaxID=6945 RepID=B7PW18_IXOSC|nr:conserved hypothetical protein [Ixodes scapularis]|eukprot:XP_002409106.1 conserved hypothetical protein [Ixodes scapularis]
MLCLFRFRMCLLFIYTNPDAEGDGYSLVLVNVRDEFFHRPTKPADFWENAPHIIGGRDQEKGREGGTWLAVSKTGRIAALLNILQRSNIIDATKKGRGFLVVDFVQSSQDGETYLNKLMQERNDYNGFLLITVETKPLKKKCFLNYYSNLQEGAPTHLDPGFHAFGNSVPPYFWSKVTGGKQMFEAIVKENCSFSQRETLVSKLFDFLQDTTPYPVDDSMRSQSEELDATLEIRNRIKFALPKWNYGTRTHTIVLVNGQGKAEFIEKTMKEPIDIGSKVEWETRSYSFSIE